MPNIRFNDNPVNTIAIDLTTVVGYDTPHLERLKRTPELEHCVFVYSRKRTNNVIDWYALVYMEQPTSNCCSICIEDIEKMHIQDEHCITSCNHIFHKECIQAWVTTQVKEQPGTPVKCPLCREELKLTSANHIICQGQAATKYNRTWVSYVMELERKLPNKLKELSHINSISNNSKEIRKILSDCTKLLKRWFFSPRASGRVVNKNIALVITLYKYCVYIIVADSAIATEHQKELSILAIYKYFKYQKMVSEFQTTPSMLEAAVKLAREECIKLAAIPRPFSEAESDAFIRSNYIFPPDGDLRTVED